MEKPVLLRHLAGEPTDRFPVWLMRQAGRYLPRYQKIRSDHSFWEMVQSPQLVSEITLLPLEVAPVDGLVFFSDILTWPRGAGVTIAMDEKGGPSILEPLQTCEAFERHFENFDPQKHVPYVGEALAEVRLRMPQNATLIGFAGGPWTLATYLSDTRQGRQLGQSRWMQQWAKRDYEGCVQALRLLAECTWRYVQFQIQSGAQLIQIFDTWISELPSQNVEGLVTAYVEILADLFRRIQATGTPGIYFFKGHFPSMASLSQVPCAALSVGPEHSLSSWEAILGGCHALQGNLDPMVLLAGPEVVRFKTQQLVAEARKLKHPAILNLGHGVLPQTPVEAVSCFVQEAQQVWM